MSQPRRKNRNWVHDYEDFVIAAGHPEGVPPDKLLRHVKVAYDELVKARGTAQEATALKKFARTLSPMRQWLNAMSVMAAVRLDGHDRSTGEIAQQLQTSRSAVSGWLREVEKVAEREV